MRIKNELENIKIVVNIINRMRILKQIIPIETQNIKVN